MRSSELHLPIPTHFANAVALHVSSGNLQDTAATVGDFALVGEVCDAMRGKRLGVEAAVCLPLVGGMGDADTQ